MHNVCTSNKPKITWITLTLCPQKARHLQVRYCRYRLRYRSLHQPISGISRRILAIDTRYKFSSSCITTRASTTAPVIVSGRHTQCWWCSCCSRVGLAISDVIWNCELHGRRATNSNHERLLLTNPRVPVLYRIYFYRLVTQDLMQDFTRGWRHILPPSSYLPYI